MVSSPNYKLLQKEGAKVEEAMNQTKGIISVLKHGRWTKCFIRDNLSPVVFEGKMLLNKRVA